MNSEIAGPLMLMDYHDTSPPMLMDYHNACPLMLMGYHDTLALLYCYTITILALVCGQILLAGMHVDLAGTCCLDKYHLWECMWT